MPGGCPGLLTPMQGLKITHDSAPLGAQPERGPLPRGLLRTREARSAVLSPHMGTVSSRNWAESLDTYGMSQGPSPH